tara:strand:- start:153 stop:302 length:150 start_codon:yes stop_codon:yes gene_type:complete
VLAMPGFVLRAELLSLAFPIKATAHQTTMGVDSNLEITLQTGLMKENQA